MKFSFKKLLILIIIIAICCAGSVFAYSSYIKNKGVIKTELFPIEKAILVNLQDNKILKTSITLEYTGDKTLDLINKDISKISDAIISTLSGKKAENIDSTKERVDIKKELSENINTALKEKVIVNTLFTEFIID